MTDLTFAEDGNSDIDTNGEINYTKRWRFYQILKDIGNFQKKSFFFQEISEMASYLNQLSPIEEEERFLFIAHCSLFIAHCSLFV